MMRLIEHDDVETSPSKHTQFYFILFWNSIHIELGANNKWLRKNKLLYIL
jgi:hypothetical protein